VLLLYLLAIDRGWITPPVRVFIGATMGVLLLVAGIRLPSRPASDPGDLGFRELLLGAALAIWYVTAYAAAVWYQLIPMSAAWIVFFLLGIASAWIALQERREIFGLVAVSTGFATPFILPSPVQSMTALSLYLGAVTAMGLMIYLMRGWQSIAWITFVGFWMSVALPANARIAATPIVLDSFDAVGQWTTSSTPGVDISINPEANGANGRAMRLDFDFHGRTTPAYAIAHRALDITLPRDYAFSFAVRGVAPVNTLEFKLIDSTGTNVWWSHNPYFVFPQSWMTVARRKGDIYFAFGPTRAREIEKVSAIELAITAGSGGKGSVWIDDLAVTHYVTPAAGSIALSILLILAAAAFTRVPGLRRKLLALNSPRYTPAPATSGSRRVMDALDDLSAMAGGGKSAPDSLTVWALMLTSAVLAVAVLGAIWPQQPKEVGGVGLLLLGFGAFGLFRRGAEQDAEIAHVTLTAGVLWILIGVWRLAPTPESLAACALVAAFVISSVSRQYAGPRVVAKLAIGFALLVIASQDRPWFRDTGLVRLRWILSSIVTLGATTFVVHRIIPDPAEEKQGLVLGGIGYFTALLFIARALGPIWEPLVTATYAGLGAALLILSRREGARPMLRYLGGATMLIVVGRLLFIDLAGVETIWRVLLFLFAGAVFLYTAHRMQPRGEAP
jgi:hypothetical protein